MAFLSLTILLLSCADAPAQADVAMAADTESEDVVNCSEKIVPGCPCAPSQAFDKCCTDYTGGLNCTPDKEEETYHWTMTYGCGCVACSGYERHAWCLGYAP